MIGEIINLRHENAKLKEEIANAQSTYLQFCKKHDEKLAKAIEALKDIEDLATGHDCRMRARAALKEMWRF